jgi:predicted membrane protein
MRRRTFDIILTAIGGVLAVGLLVAGGLLTWGYHFANSTVHDQLAAQQIFFPAKGSDALASPEIGPYLNKYAGQQLTTGAQAEAYADHFIKVHLTEVAGGKTYAQVSSAAQQNPTDQKLQAQVQTLFRGETLRGMLLNAYAFWKFGQIALYAAIASFVGAALLLVLTALGFRHSRRVDTQAEVFEKKSKTPIAA